MKNKEIKVGSRVDVLSRYNERFQSRGMRNGVVKSIDANKVVVFRDELTDDMDFIGTLSGGCYTYGGYHINLIN